VLVSEVFLLIGVFLLVLSLVCLIALFFIDVIFGNKNSAQEKQSYTYNFAEHQNYWEADK
jgi:ABC-type transporter Mla subunit MlaD